MRQLYRILLGVALACALVMGVAHPSFAQNITTGTLTGVVMDAQKGVLPGATVTAVHVPTGTTYEAVTQADGRFTMNAVRVGGPYTVKVTMSGFKTQELTNVVVALGEAREVQLSLEIAAVAETVNVVAAAQIIDTTRAGTASNVAAQAIETLPTISRSISDFARTSPFFNSTVDSANGDYAQVIVAGRNNRYNNMQIDGAVNNDVFGLASSGTPGGQTSTQPISLDAVQEIQLVVSPYDVRQGGFTGGGINAVTKSGTNTLHGTGYWYQRNQNLIGRIPSVISPNSTATAADTKVGAFKDRQPGFTLGGPIVQNKAFFFGNVDVPRKSTPVGFSADGSSGQKWGNQSYVQQVVDIAKGQYGYDPGGLSEMSKQNNSDKVFVRGDFNLSGRHQLTVRTNYVNAVADVGGSSNTSYNMPSNFYHMTDKMISSVAQLNSNFGTAFNELRVVYSRERNIRGGQVGYPNFPQVQVTLPDTTSVYMGTEYASQGNKLNQDIVEATDDLTLVKGQHTFSIGTHNEFYKFYNLYLPNGYGSYRFSSITNFQAGIAQSYSYQYSNDRSNPLWGATFSVRQFGAYAGDKWRAKSNLTLTYGVRFDLPRFPDLPHANPIAISEFGYATDSMPSPMMWSPRVGFNWDLSGATKRQLRGGVGLFTGRTPYVWLSNQYGNTGVDLTTLSVSYSTSNTLKFLADPNNQPTTVTGGTTGRQTINVVDPNYKYPGSIRTNLGFDHDLGVLGLIGTAEFLFTKNVHDVNYNNLNYVNTGGLQVAPAFGDYRLKLAKLDSSLNDVMLLYNTSEGYSWNVAYKLERPFKNGFSASGSILYGHSYSVNDGTSSVARSNWSNDPAAIDVNHPVLTTSNYDPGLRINLAATIPIPMPKNLRSTVSFFFNGMNGRPYAQGFYNDVNGDAVTSNDLLFVPVSADQIIIKNGTWDQLNAYLSGDAAAKNHRGEINPRNSGRAPWQNQMDFRYALTIPFGGSRRAEVTADVFNFLNLLNKNWGWQYWAGFPGIANPITYGGIDKTTGKEIFDMAYLNGSTYLGTFTRDDLRSRFQAQIGLRFRF